MLINSFYDSVYVFPYGHITLLENKIMEIITENNTYYSYENVTKYFTLFLACFLRVCKIIKCTIYRFRINK